MKFTVPRYEVSYHGKEIWEDISELALMQRLHETFGREPQGRTISINYVAVRTGRGALIKDNDGAGRRAIGSRRRFAFDIP